MGTIAFPGLFVCLLFLYFSISPNRAEHKGLGVAVGTCQRCSSGIQRNITYPWPVLHSKTLHFLNYFIPMTLKNLESFKSTMAYKYFLYFYCVLHIVLISGDQMMSKLDIVFVFGKLPRERSREQLITDKK